MKTLFDENLTLEEAEDLIKSGIDFHLIHEIKDIKIFQFVVDKCSNLNMLYGGSYTLCHNTNKFEYLDILIKAGVDVNKKDIYGLAPIYYIDKLLEDKIIKLLIKAGANLNLLCHGKSLLSTILYYQELVPECKSFWNLKAQMLIDQGAVASDTNTYEKFRNLFTSEQKVAFDTFESITNNYDDFFALCLAYQENIKNNVKIEINDLDIL